MNYLCLYTIYSADMFIHFDFIMQRSDVIASYNVINVCSSDVVEDSCS